MGLADGAPGDVSVGSFDIEKRFEGNDDAPENFNDHYEDAIAHFHGYNADAEANAALVVAAIEALPELIERLEAYRARARDIADAERNV